MSDHTTQEIPYGYCQCGCGKKTRIAPYNFTRPGWIVGEPIPFLQGHSRPKPPPIPEPNPSGLCMCGCGQPAPIAKKTYFPDNAIKGQPLRYIRGHVTRTRIPPSNADKLKASTKRGGPDDCWIWTGALDHRGYGKITTYGKTVGTHRIAYELEYGSIPEGLNVLHKCDNPPCCNPTHLFVGTDADNIADKIAKGRQPRGEHNGSAKLTEAAVLEIRRLHREGVAPRDIAHQYGVCNANVYNIVNRKSWKHIP